MLQCVLLWHYYNNNSFCLQLNIAISVSFQEDSLHTAAVTLESVYESWPKYPNRCYLDFWHCCTWWTLGQIVVIWKPLKWFRGYPSSGMQCATLIKQISDVLPVWCASSILGLLIFIPDFPKSVTFTRVFLFADVPLTCKWSSQLSFPTMRPIYVEFTLEMEV